MGWERIIAARERQLAAAAGEPQPAVRRALADRRTQPALVFERARKTWPCS